MKYTCQPTGNSLDELGIPKNPYFDPSHASVASFWLIPGGGAFYAYIYIPALKGLTEDYEFHLILFYDQNLPQSLVNPIKEN